MIGYQFLLEIDALDNLNNPVTKRFCCQPGFSGGGYTWEPYIVDPGLVQTTLFSGDKMTGKSSHSFGEVVLGNFKDVTDVTGPTDYLKDYKFYGRPIRMYMGLAAGSYPAEFQQQYVGIIENFTIGEDTVSFTLHGRQAELNIPLDGGTFLGDNVAPGGFEGDATLKGANKPIVIGRVFNAPVSLCNASKLIYAVSPLTGIATLAELNSGLRVFDNGVELFCTGSVASKTDLLTGTTNPGEYRASSDGYIQLGSTPVGQITVSCASQGKALASTPVNLITQIFTLADAVPGRTHSNFVDMIDGDSFTGFADTFERGLFIRGNLNISEILDKLVTPCGYWYFTPLGKIRVKTIALSGFTPTYAAVGSTNIESFSIHKTSDTKGGVPASSVVLKCSKNNTLQANLSTKVDAIRGARLGLEWLRYEIPSTDFIFPLSEEFVIETALHGSTYFDQGAYDLKTIVRTIFCKKHSMAIVGISTLDFLNALPVQPGDVITLDLAGRFGYSGDSMLVVGKTINYVEETVSLVLWDIAGD